MSTTTLLAAPDRATVDRLATALNRCFETFTADADVFTADAFFDLFPPFWRFQLQGPDAMLAQLRRIAQGPPTVRRLRTVPTATGFVLEHEETQGDEVARRLLLCEVHDGRIAGMKPSAPEGLLGRDRIVVVALHHDVAARDDFAERLAIRRGLSGASQR